MICIRSFVAGIKHVFMGVTMYWSRQQPPVGCSTAVVVKVGIMHNDGVHTSDTEFSSYIIDEWCACELDEQRHVCYACLDAWYKVEVLTWVT